MGTPRALTRGIARIALGREVRTIPLRIRSADLKSRGPIYQSTKGIESKAGDGHCVCMIGLITSRFAHRLSFASG